MSYKCRICGSNEVEHSGDICELCALGQDPYVSAMNGLNDASYRQADAPSAGSGKVRKVLINGGGSALTNTDPYGNSIVPLTEETEAVQVYAAGQTPIQTQSAAVTGYGQANANGHSSLTTGKEAFITSGITKNITVNEQKYSFLRRWFRTLFTGVPLTLEDNIIMFQVFPDYTGTSLNAVGNVCDQVIVYGRMNVGAVAENNDVEVYGRRDANNNIIAKMIRNKASGTTVTPEGRISVAVVWGVTIAVFAAIFYAVSFLGVNGIVWAIVLLLCITNLPAVCKIIGVILGGIFSIFRRR